MLKICYLPTSFEIDRKEASNISLRLISSEIAKKNKVFIITGNIRNKPTYEEFKQVKIIRKSKIYGLSNKYNIFENIKAIWTHLFASYFSFINYKKNIYFDIIHGISSSSILSLRTLIFKKKYKNSKYIHTIKGSSSKKEFSIITKYLLNKLDAIIVLNKITRNKLINQGVKKEKIHLIYSPIDLTKFKPKNKIKLKKEYGYTKKIILYYGHFNEFKGVEYLIKSIKHIKTKNIQVILIPSEDEQKNKYDEIINKEKAKEKIKVLNSNVNIIDYVNMADVSCFPYPELISTESNPSCILESMACKTPVITSNLIELKEFIINGKNAILTKPKDPKNIAEKIDLILNNKKLYSKLIESGFKTSKKFNHKIIAQKHLDLYNSLQ